MPISSIPARLITAQGAAPSYAARAWVNFNGTGTPAIRASGNVSSITDNAVADFTVNFATPMPDANYSFVTSTNQNSSAWLYTVMGHDSVAATTSAWRLKVVGQNASTTAGSDNVVICAAIFS